MPEYLRNTRLSYVLVRVSVGDNSKEKIILLRKYDEINLKVKARVLSEVVIVVTAKKMERERDRGHAPSTAENDGKRKTNRGTTPSIETRPSGNWKVTKNPATLKRHESAQLRR